MAFWKGALESVDMKAHRLEPSFWLGRKVFITGHTGFKGSWLALWLAKMGAHVSGYALAPETTLSLFELANVQSVMASQWLADVRDISTLIAAVHAASPEIIFHLAAQPLVRRSYRDPLGTWTANVIGTANVLEAGRACSSVKAIIVVTSDKCYENREWHWGYRECDPLGGYDPYSASKASCELLVQSYRRSFLAERGVLVASVRAGNVIGGGDFSEDRLVPDAFRAVKTQQPLLIRNPQATRPWQHVLDVLHGYLLLGERLLEGNPSCADAFNFGPSVASNHTVIEVLNCLRCYWPELKIIIDGEAAKFAMHEAKQLFLDSTKAYRMFGWVPVWTIEQSLEKTAAWYSAVLENNNRINELTLSQIDQFLSIPQADKTQSQVATRLRSDERR